VEDDIVPVDDLQPGPSVPKNTIITPLMGKKCKKADKVRALAYNDNTGEIAALSLNANVHIWDSQRFTQVSCLFINMYSIVHVYVK
jgi:hypothetical protein